MIGSMRGWAKELLVAFSVILAIFIVSILESLVPNLMDTITKAGAQAYFWVRALLLTFLVFFGYQTPNIPKLGGARFARERLQDIGLPAGNEHVRSLRQEPPGDVLPHVAGAASSYHQCFFSFKTPHNSCSHRYAV